MDEMHEVRPPGVARDDGPIHFDRRGRVREAADAPRVKRAKDSVEDSGSRRTASGRAELPLELILRDVADGVTAQDAAGRLVYANDAALRLLGFASIDELLATPPAEILARYEILDEHGDPFPPDRLPARVALATGREQRAVVRYRAIRTGEERWSMVRGSAICDDTGAVRYAISVFHDITEQKRAEDEQRFLTRSGADLALTLDFRATLHQLSRLAVPRLGDTCLICLVDAAGGVREVAAAFGRLQHELTHAVDAGAASAAGRDLRGEIGRTVRSCRPSVVHDVALSPSTGAGGAGTARSAAPNVSVIFVPLLARGRTFGLAAYLSTDATHETVDARLGLAVALTSRAALAADNAFLYEAEQLARARAMRLQELTAALSRAATASEVVHAVVAHAAAATGAAGGTLACLSDDGTTFEVSRMTGLRDEPVSPPATFSASARLPIAEAAYLRRLVIVRSLDEALARYPERVAELSATGCTALIAVPLVLNERVLATLELTFRAAPRHEDDDQAFLLTLGRLCAQALERSRLYDRERQARAAADTAKRRSAFLAEASQVLSSSLDYEPTLHSVARLAVPTLADWCAVDMLGPDSRIDTVAVAHVDSAPAEWGRQLGRMRSTLLDSLTGLGRALRTGRTDFVAEVTDAVLVAAARSAEDLEQLRRIAVRSYMCVPITVRGTTLGAITFVRTSDRGDLYGDADVSLAEDLARRAATAIDNSRLHRHLVMANQAKANFLAVMSHELRTPLNAVLGYASLMSDGVFGPVTPIQQEQLGRIAASSTHLRSIIEEILGFAHLEAGIERVRRESVRIEEIAREVVQLTEPMVRRKGLACVLDAGPVGEPLVTDGTKLRQILLNLLSNAVRFTAHGEVRLEVRRDGDRIRLVVRDTGIGIRPEHHEQIFETFWQVEQSSTRTVGGTGIGLSIARRLARLLGGDISVESTIGRGSVFTVDLPLEPQP